MIVGMEPSETMRVLNDLGNPDVKAICNIRAIQTSATISGELMYPEEKIHRVPPPPPRKTGGKVKETAILMHGSNQQEILPASGQAVAFKIITPGGDAKLEATSVTTDQDGLASTFFQAGQIELAAPYQVEASVPGTCPVTFSVEVRKPLLQLRAITPSPYDTFTHSRVPVSVEATTDGFARLSDREITFSFKLGKTPETTLSDLTDTGPGGDTLKLKTDVGGRATAMLSTGSQPIPQLVVKAEYQDWSNEAETGLDRINLALGYVF